jgi:adenylate cyclase
VLPVKEIRKRLWEWRGVAIAAPLVAGVVLLLRATGGLQPLEWAAYDQYMRLRPVEPHDQRIVIVGIDDADLQSIGQTLGQTIIPDAVYAQVLEKLKAHKPRAIGLDIYRDLPVEPGHKQLVQVFETTPNLVGIQKVSGQFARETVAPPPALKAKGQVGANDVVIDADNTLRRSVVQVQEPNGDRVMGFGFYLAALYLDAQGVKPEFLPETQIWTLGQTAFPAFTANDGGYVRADDRGYQLLINYRGATRTFETVSLRDVLNDKLPADWGRDRIIMIGAVSESLKDNFYTPHSSRLGGSPETMPGVEIHANFVSQLLSATLDGRSLIQTWSEPIEDLWILAWAAMGAAVAWQMRQTSKFTSQRILLTLGMGGLLLGSTAALFVAGWWVPVVPPFMALVGSSVAIMGYVARSAGRIRKTFGRYLTDEIVANLLESPKGLSMGGERREITILTSDLRGFTATAERLPPEEVIRIINFYLSHMADVITQYQGTIDEFMGDGILVLFGAPTQREDDAERAIACAVAMQMAMETINATMQEWGYSALEMGIGINTGEVIVGNIGSEKRTKYGVMGSQVNLTYRIESYTTAGQILISDKTLHHAGAAVRLNGQTEVKPKGVQKPITIYDVGGIAGHYNLFLTQEEEVFLPLPAAIAVSYATLSGKHVDETIHAGQFIHLSAKGALLQPFDSSLTNPPPLTNLKLNLKPDPNLVSPDLSEDIYAKVVNKPPEHGGFYVQFTGKSRAIATYLETLYNSLTHH